MRGNAGITLMEMLIVVALIGLLIGISFPAVTSGIDSLRLTSATDSVASFLNGALNRAERRQQVVEITVSRADNSIALRSTEPGFYRKLEMTDGVSIVGVLPQIPVDPEAPRSFLVFPGGTVPRLGVVLRNRKGARRQVQVDPITGVPRVEQLEEQ